jgi:hypothetical protein
MAGILRSFDSSGATIIAEADESSRNLLYFGFDKKEMHPLDAF